MNPRHVHSAANCVTQFPPTDDIALCELIEEMSVNKSCLWNSLEIKDAHTNYGNLQIYSSSAASLQYIQACCVDDIDDNSVAHTAKAIKKEALQTSADRYTYKTRLSVEDATDVCSDVLLHLLAELSPKLDHTNTALLIGNMVTSAITHRPTTLQITLGTLLGEKLLIEQCSEFGITCSYDEILRFKKSVAHAASREKHLQGLMDSKVGLVQTVADNFDANIASPNGLKSTHSLALLITQLQEHTEHVSFPNSPTIRRLRRWELHVEPTLRNYGTTALGHYGILRK